MMDVRTFTVYKVKTILFNLKQGKEVTALVEGEGYAGEI